MSRQRPILTVLAAVSFLAALAGCAAVPSRVVFTAAEQAAAEPVGFAGVRTWADGAFGPQLRSWLPGSRQVAMLALSGGSDSGAYGAGFLNGWSESGQRPAFDVVTGVSTGALIAPFAFLGPAYDPVLRDLYTRTAASEVFTARPIVAGLFGSSLASSAPLRRRIAELVTPDLLARIAAEHQRGRRLFVVTTNLDAQRPVVWNLGALAARPEPQALQLFRDVLLASAAVPGVFPAVPIEVAAGGRRFEELHADGGTTLQLLTVGEPLLLDRRPAAGRSLDFYILVNKALQPEFEVVENRTAAVSERGLFTLIKASLRKEVLSTYTFARSTGAGFHLTFVGDDFPLPYDEPFDPVYMRRLFDYGVARGRANDWLAAPPLADAAATPRT